MCSYMFTGYLKSTIKTKQTTQNDLSMTVLVVKNFFWEPKGEKFSIVIRIVIQKNVL